MACEKCGGRCRGGHDGMPLVLEGVIDGVLGRYFGASIASRLDFAESVVSRATVVQHLAKAVREHLEAPAGGEAIRVFTADGRGHLHSGGIPYVEAGHLLVRRLDLVTQAVYAPGCWLRVERVAG